MSDDDETDETTETTNEEEKAEEEPERDEYLLAFIYSETGSLIINKYDVEKAEWFDSFGAEELETKEFLAKHGNTVFLIENDELYTLDLTTKAIEKYQCEGIPKEIFAAPIIGDTIYLITESGGVYDLNINDRMVNKCADLKYAGKTTTTVINGILYIISRSDEFVWTFNPDTKEVRQVASFPLSPKFRRKIRFMEVSDFKGYDPVADFRKAPTHICSLYMFYTDKLTLKVTGTDCAFVIPIEYNGKLYAIENNSSRYLYEYSPDIDEWKTIRVKRPFQVYVNAQIVTHKGNIFCIGGNAVAQYHFENNQWETKGDNESCGWLIERIYSIEKIDI